MIGKRTGVRGPVVAFVVVAALSGTAARGDEPAGGAPLPAAPESLCHRDEDLACTVVRETPDGVWVWTERFRAAVTGSPNWSLAIGGGAVSPQPTVRFLANGPPSRTTANGSPILE